MNPSEREELDWLAFRYVAGELTCDEQAEFELRLEHDHAACRAVAEAVELTDAICVVEKDNSPCVRIADSRSRPRAVMLIAWLSACVLLLITGLWFSYDHDASTTINCNGDATATDAAELAVVWSELRAELADQEDQSWTWSEPIESDDLLLATNDADSLITPDWMFSAVVAVETTETSDLLKEPEDG